MKCAQLLLEDILVRIMVGENFDGENYFSEWCFSLWGLGVGKTLMANLFYYEK